MRKRSEAEVEAAKQAAVDAEAKRGGVKGNGWLKKRGRFYVAFWKFNGRLHKKTTKETSESKARAKLAEFVAPFKAKRIDSDVDAVSLAVSSGEEKKRRVLAHLPALATADAFAVFCKLEAASYLKPRSLANRRMMLNTFANWFDGRRDGSRRTELREVTATDSRAFLDDLKMRGVSLQSCANYVGNLKATWSAIAKNEEERAADGKNVDQFAGHPLARLVGNPWAKVQSDYSKKAIRAKGAVRQKREMFSLDEMRRIFASADGEYKTLFQIGALTGLRLGDAACLKWGENVQLDNGETGRLTVTPKKTNHSSGVQVVRALGRELHDILAALPCAKTNGEYILPQCATRYLQNPALLSLSVQRRIRRAGIETKVAVAGSSRARVLKGFHSLRYSYVSIRANNGEDLDAIRADVGHTSTKMTETYHQRDDAAREREAAVVSDFFTASRKPSKTPQKRETVAAGEVGRADVADAQKPVFDAVCAMLGNLEPQTLRAVASEALKLAMRNAAKSVSVGGVAAAS